jgi:hypothetical protein
MDRDRNPRLEQRQSLRRLAWVEMEATAERRAPAPDRQERDVEVWHEPGHPLEQIGVACEVDPL